MTTYSHDEIRALLDAAERPHPSVSRNILRANAIPIITQLLAENERLQRALGNAAAELGDAQRQTHASARPD